MDDSQLQHAANSLVAQVITNQTKVVIAIDFSSGFVKFFTEDRLAALARAIRQCPSVRMVEVLIFSDRVYDSVTFTNGDDIHIPIPRAGNGTIADGVFAHVGNSPDTSLIFLTDGYVAVDCAIPDIPVGWFVSVPQTSLPGIIVFDGDMTLAA